MDWIENRLHELADTQTEYREFNTRTLATVAPERVMGVRVPALRKLAREVNRSSDRDSFLAELPHRWYEEDALHAFILCLERDYPRAVTELEAFLPHVDNWATCDALNPRAFKELAAEGPGGIARLHTDALRWMSSTHTYTRRFGISILMHHLLGEGFDEAMLAEAAACDNGEYYVRMMIAWYCACALEKRWEQTVVWLEEHRMDPWVHNKSIQKAIESRVIPPERKAYLRTLRVRKDGSWKTERGTSE